MKAMMKNSEKDVKIEQPRKEEVKVKEEKTTPTRYYKPDTDIFETDDSLMVTMDMPGVRREDITINLENNSLEIEGKIDCRSYADYEPIYAEYNIGNYFRNFKLSHTIDKNKIEAKMKDGVLHLTLPKLPDEKARKIEVR